jgi:hypothetical protein
MIRIRTMYVYLLIVGMACTCVSYAMDTTKKENDIDRKKIAEMVNVTLKKMEAVSEIGEVSDKALAILQQDVPAIAQAAKTPDRVKIIAQSLRMAKYQNDYMKQEPDFHKRHQVSQRKMWEQINPYYVRTVPYDCTVIAKQYVCTMVDKKKDRNYKDMAPWEHTMHANQYSIHDAQSVILIAIREYTRDYSKRCDGKLNPDQLIECTVQFGEPLSCEHTFDIYAGDAWQLLEEMMKEHLEDHLKTSQNK